MVFKFFAAIKELDGVYGHVICDYDTTASETTTTIYHQTKLYLIFIRFSLTHMIGGILSLACNIFLRRYSSKIGSQIRHLKRYK